MLVKVLNFGTNCGNLCGVWIMVALLLRTVMRTTTWLLLATRGKIRPGDFVPNLRERFIESNSRLLRPSTSANEPI